ncbi:MAG: hypothetical protein GY754_13400 [bacterium]|nr:hypothetical protein [bacterium]
MNVLKLIPVFISFLLLGAHFFRTGLLPFVVLCMVLSFFLFVKEAWAARLLQIFLIIGAYEWVRTLLTFTDERLAMGRPWIRLVIILGMVALFTGLSALVFHSPSLKERYKLAN